MLAYILKKASLKLKTKMESLKTYILCVVVSYARSKLHFSNFLRGKAKLLGKNAAYNFLRLSSVCLKNKCVMFVSVQSFWIVTSFSKLSFNKWKIESPRARLLFLSKHCQKSFLTNKILSLQCHTFPIYFALFCRFSVSKRSKNENERQPRKHAY